MEEVGRGKKRGAAVRRLGEAAGLKFHPLASLRFPKGLSSSCACTAQVAGSRLGQVGGADKVRCEGGAETERPPRGAGRGGAGLVRGVGAAGRRPGRELGRGQSRAGAGPERMRGRVAGGEEWDGSGPTKGKGMGQVWGCVRAEGGAGPRRYWGRVGFEGGDESREGSGGRGRDEVRRVGGAGGREGVSGAGPGGGGPGDKAGPGRGLVPRCPSLAGRGVGRMAPGALRGGCEQRAPYPGAAAPRSRKMWVALLWPLLRLLLLLLSPRDGVRAAQPQAP